MSGRRRRRRRDPVRVADRLGRFSRGSTPAGTGIGALREAWQQVAGEQVARRSIPLRRSRAGVLTIACADAAWAQELAPRHDMLLDALRRAAPDVHLTRLRFSVSSKATSQPREPEPRPTAAPTPGRAAREAARRLAGQVSDDRLSELVERAASHGLERAERHKTFPAN